MEMEIGIEDARKTIGDIANRSHMQGQTTYLTRNGKRIAAVVPLDRTETSIRKTGEARWDKQTMTLTITPEWGDDQVIRVTETAAWKHRTLHPTHVLALAGWNIAPGATPFHLSPTGETQVVHYLPTPGQDEQLAAWSAEYGHHEATVRGTAGRVRFLVTTDPDTALLEGDTLLLETTDPNGTLYERASTAMAAETHRANTEDRPSRHTLAALIQGIGI